MAEQESATKILDYLKEKGLISTRRISQELGMPMDVARSLLNQLWEEQRVGRKVALDASSADASGGAELWHIVGWKNGPQSNPIEPKPEPAASGADVVALQPQRKVRDNAKKMAPSSPSHRKPRRTLELRVAVLQVLAGTSRPVALSRVSKGGKMKNENAKAALSVLVKAGFVTSSKVSESRTNGTCPTCGAPTSSKEFYRITGEGKEFLRWLRKNRKAVNRLQAIS